MISAQDFTYLNVMVIVNRNDYFFVVMLNMNYLFLYRDTYFIFRISLISSSEIEQPLKRIPQIIASNISFLFITLEFVYLSKIPSSYAIILNSVDLNILIFENSFKNCLRLFSLTFTFVWSLLRNIFARSSGFSMINLVVLSSIIFDLLYFLILLLCLINVQDKFL